MIIMFWLISLLKRGGDNKGKDSDEDEDDPSSEDGNDEESSPLFKTHENMHMMSSPLFREIKKGVQPIQHARDELERIRCHGKEARDVQEQERGGDTSIHFGLKTLFPTLSIVASFENPLKQHRILVVK
jgi:hypothetical protein